MVRIIKGGGLALPAAESKSVQVVPINLNLLHASRGGGRSGPDEVDDPVSRARAAAEKIVREARSQAEAIRERAYNEGQAARAADCAKALQELMDRLESETAEVTARREALVDEIEPQALMLCLEAVEKILRHEIRTDRRVVERTIKACLRRVRDSAEATIRVSPQELEHVQAVREDLLAAADGITSVDIVEDRRVSPGGCVVESSSGSLDARMETQLDTLRQRLTETLENDGGGGTGPDEVLRDGGED